MYFHSIEKNSILNSSLELYLSASVTQLGSQFTESLSLFFGDTKGTQAFTLHIYFIVGPHVAEKNREKPQAVKIFKVENLQKKPNDTLKMHLILQLHAKYAKPQKKGRCLTEYNFFRQLLKSKTGYMKCINKTRWCYNVATC